MSSETAKYREQVLKYCQGNGLDLGSAGDPVVPTAIQVELPNNYCPFLASQYPPQLRGDASCLLWFCDDVMDFLFSSHLIEDFHVEDQPILLQEWCRVIKPGGHLIIMAPERHKWQEALKNGQPPNNAHQHELVVGEIAGILQRIEPDKWEVVEDRLCDPNDYSLLFVARKK